MRAPGMVAVAAAGVVLCACGPGGSGAVETYESFAGTAVRGDHGAAAAFCEGEAVRAALKNEGSYTPPMMEAYHGARYRIESRQRSGDEVSLVAVMTVSYDPPGAYAAMGGAMESEFRHRVKVAKRAGAWKVVAFESEPLETIELR